MSDKVKDDDEPAEKRDQPEKKAQETPYRFRDFALI